jgi:hypothetical protein
MGYQSKADKMFEEKAQRAMELNRPDLMIEVGEQYEAYEKLVTPWPDEIMKDPEEPSKELEFVGHGKPTPVEAHNKMLSSQAFSD